MWWTRELCFALACAVLVRAQCGTLDLDRLRDAGLRWAEQNLNEELVQAVRNLDSPGAQSVFRNLRSRYQGEYRVDFDPLRKTLLPLLPLLELHPRTRPCSAWFTAGPVRFLLGADSRFVIQPVALAMTSRTPAATTVPRAWRLRLEDRSLPRRAAEYVTRLKPIFAAERVPDELVWLAEVESAFDPRALSPVGAAGLYQLMPGTARQYGLSLRPRDDRFHPEKNAQAAARYLRYLSDRFQDWPLAIAAYNAGENRVQGLLARHNASRLDQIVRHLPLETRQYVPKVEATLALREGVTLARLELATQ